MKRLLPIVILLAGCSSATHPHSFARSIPAPTTVPFRYAPPGHCHYQMPQDLPDPACTPGVTNPKVTQANIGSTICVSGWTKTIRPPSVYTDAYKASQIAAYGLGGSSSLYEEDHRIPLEVGGNPIDPANLWPETWSGQYGAHAKDAIENKVKREVCSGQMSLASGQHVFEGDWWNAKL